VAASSDFPLHGKFTTTNLHQDIEKAMRAPSKRPQKKTSIENHCITTANTLKLSDNYTTTL